jgi:hypothetical protein
VYADPITATSHAEVGHYELGASEIIEKCDNLAMTIDLSTITVPGQLLFRDRHRGRGPDRQRAASIYWHGGCS